MHTTHRECVLVLPILLFLLPPLQQSFPYNMEVLGEFVNGQVSTQSHLACGLYEHRIEPVIDQWLQCREFGPQLSEQYKCGERKGR